MDTKKIFNLFFDIFAFPLLYKVPCKKQML